MPKWTAERTHRNVCTIRMNVASSDWEQWVLLRSDVHHDNPKCDWDMETKHLDEAKQHDAPIIDNGDLFCAMQGKYDKRADKSSVRPEHQEGNYLDLLVSTAAKFYQPYAANLVVLGRGNHETAIRKNHETDLTDRLVEGLKGGNKPSPVMASGYGGWVRFQFTMHKTKRDSIILQHYHGTGGGGPVTRGVIQTNRMAVFNPDPQIILTGHTHDEWVLPIARQRISAQGVPYHDEQVHVRVPGYKDAWQDGHAGWEVEKMLGPKPKGAAWVRFYYQDNSIRFEVTRAK